MDEGKWVGVEYFALGNGALELVSDVLSGVSRCALGEREMRVWMRDQRRRVDRMRRLSGRARLEGTRGSRCATASQCADPVPCDAFTHLCGESWDEVGPRPVRRAPRAGFPST